MQVEQLNIEDLEETKKWAKKMREDRKAGLLPENVIERLDAMNFVWDERQAIFRSIFGCNVEVVTDPDISDEELESEWDEIKLLGMGDDVEGNA